MLLWWGKQGMLLWWGGYPLLSSLVLLYISVIRSSPSNNFISASQTNMV
jgi:hypothetical protein